MSSSSASKATSQGKVFLQWVSLYIGEKVALEDFQDGVVLNKLMKEIKRLDKLPVHFQVGKNKLQVLGNIANILKYIADQGVRLTCSPEDIFDCRENMILGLIWILILQFQVVNKSEILDWVRECVSVKGIQISNFDSNWVDGVSFAALVSSLKPDQLDFEAVSKLSPQERLTQTFEVARVHLNVPPLLETDGGYLDERCVLTYLSYFYNNFKSFKPVKVDYKSMFESLKEEIDSERLKVQELTEKLADAEGTSKQILEKTTSDMKALKDENAKITEDLAMVTKQNAILSRQLLDISFRLEESKAPSTKAPEGNVTLVFTDVQSSTALWDKYPGEMAKALDTHNRLMRNLLKKYQGYEVKTEGDAFMVAFSSSLNAVNYCLTVQEELLKQTWPENLTTENGAHEERDASGNVLFKGLRVRMGIHNGDPICQPDPVTGRMDYFGPVVNRAARVSGIPFGGQIVLSIQALESARAEAKARSEGNGGAESSSSSSSPLSSSSENFPEATLKDFLPHQLTNLGKFKLKGLEEDTEVLEILPKSLTGRVFIMDNKGQAEAPNLEVKSERSIKQELERLKKDHAALQEKLQQLKHSAEMAQKKAEELSEWVESQRLALEAGGGKFGEIIGKVEWITNNHNEIQQLVRDTEEKTSYITDLVNRLDGDVQSMSKDYQETEMLKSSVEDLTSKVTESAQSIAELTTARETLTAQITDLEEKLTNKEEELNDLRDQYTKLQALLPKPKEKETSILKRIIRRRSVQIPKKEEGSTSSSVAGGAGPLDKELKKEKEKEEKREKKLKEKKKETKPLAISLPLESAVQDAEEPKTSPSSSATTAPASSETIESPKAKKLTDDIKDMFDEDHLPEESDGESDEGEDADHKEKEHKESCEKETIADHDHDHDAEKKRDLETDVPPVDHAEKPKETGTEADKEHEADKDKKKHKNKHKHDHKHKHHEDDQHHTPPASSSTEGDSSSAPDSEKTVEHESPSKKEKPAKAEKQSSSSALPKDGKLKKEEDASSTDEKKQKKKRDRSSKKLKDLFFPGSSSSVDKKSTAPADPPASTSSSDKTSSPPSPHS
eukprot:TRINITY_DN1764_c0_g3_i2.p1 TRINITY_DN1764_c0_g3~~TRINITY_DN1764_c0_g3_i2.p1  ORF type:complete len:1071 (+),score=614.96 TRINITY_DN1764_c0_g3_i2:168-3380(+)